VPVKRPEQECPVRLFIDGGRVGAELSKCYADAVNPVAQGKDLSTCLGAVPSCTVSSAGGCLSASDCGGVGDEMKPQVCSIARDVLGSCLDSRCSRIACDYGDP